MTEHSTVHVLWARSERYKRRQFVAAWSDGYVEAWHDAYVEERAERAEWFSSFGDRSDGPWTFWMTVEHITPNQCEHDFQHHPESEDFGVCSSCGVEELVA